jgi:hypothetical protein
VLCCPLLTILVLLALLQLALPQLTLPLVLLHLAARNSSDSLPQLTAVRSILQSTLPLVRL